jgi:O-6-methylguanine DNA methyltransferase
MHQKIIPQNNVAYLDSPVGLLEICSDGEELVRVAFAEEKKHREESDLVLMETKKQLSEYFAGERKKFSLPLKMQGTGFQTRVWQELMCIPYGKTASYKDIAAAVGNEKACRAVGGANNKNSIAILIPCHRVVGSNKKMVGYASGIWRKEWLLEHERKFM